MPGSIASTEAGDGRATPTTTRNSSPEFLPSGSGGLRSGSVIENQVSNLNLDDSVISLPSSEETVTQKRREWYPLAWRKFLEKNNYDGVITTVRRYLDIMDKSNLDIECYFALMMALTTKKNKDSSILDEIDMSSLSDTELVDIHLLRSIIYLKYNEVDKALQEGKIASEKSVGLDLQETCYYILALIACYTEDYVEASFRKSVISEGFQLKPRFGDLIKRLSFRDAKWQIRGLTTYTDKPRYTGPLDIAKDLPIPSNFLV
ncbi:hypothetical protein H072_7074 [Dactylellina haptotyla CBS 200.50]|uniref:PCI domain-containing protein n=1 Tax=Dactylellina haptotyla (strain CBS 200.50) TaxID=1284197 RepID=S8BV03_DACHA|nr:hypothetical protein H072_7074 [Dactylellina haptotyla CBS 200.50]